MIKKNKLQIAVTSIITLLPCIAGAILKSKVMIIAPLIILAIDWISILFTSMDKRNDEQDPKTVGLVLWICPLVSLFASGMTYVVSYEEGFMFSPVVIAAVIFAGVFIAFGNYMPKTRQNSTIGIKIKSTLESTENWNMTHRFTGKLWVICGALMLIGIFLPENIFTVAFFAIICIAVALPIIYSLRFRKMQIKNGTLIISDGYKYSAKSKFLSVIVLFAVLAVVIPLMFTGDIVYGFGDTYISVDADYWDGIEIEFDSIESVEYSEDFPSGTRTSGFASAKLQLGSFRNEELGNYTRYCYNGCDSAVIIKTADKIYVINGETDESTNALYEELCKKVK